MEAAPLPPRPRPRNKIAQARHRRETLLQIYIPLVLAAGVFLAATALTFVGSFGGALQNSVMADTALVWLSVPLLFVGVVLLVLVVAVAFGVGNLLHILPPYFKQAQDFLRTQSERVVRMTDRASNQVVAVGARAAALSSLVRRGRGAGRGSTNGRVD